MKSFMTAIIAIELVFAHFSFNLALAQASNTRGNQNLQMAMGMLGQATSQFAANQQAQQSQMEAQRVFQQLQPNEYIRDGMFGCPIYNDKITIAGDDASNPGGKLCSEGAISSRINVSVSPDVRKQGVNHIRSYIDAATQAWMKFEQKTEETSQYAGSRARSGGLICLNEKKKELESNLSKRLRYFDQLKEELVKSKARFKTQFLAIEKNMIESEISLKGSKANFSGHELFEGKDKVKNYNFKKRFSSKSCSSQNIVFGKKGEESGLEGIEENLDNLYNGDEGDAENSPANLMTRAPSIEKEIRRVAHYAGEQVGNSGFSFQASGNKVKAVWPDDLYPESMQEGLTSSVFEGAKKRIMDDNQSKMQKIFKDNYTDVIAQNDDSAASQDAKTLFNDILKNPESSDVALTKYERNYNKSCFRKQMGITGLSSKSIRSQFMNGSEDQNKKNTIIKDSFFNTVDVILNNPEMTHEQALKEIIALESQGNNRKKWFYLTSSSEGDGLNKGRNKLSNWFKSINSQCKSIYSSEENLKGHSRQSLVKNARKLAKRVSNRLAKVKSQVTSDLIGSLLNCSGKTNFSKRERGCDPKSMAPSSDKFCLKAATSCSTKLNKCLSDTRAKVKAARAKRDVEVKAHRQLTAKVKTSLFTMWEKLKGQLEANSVQLTGALKVKIPGMKGSLEEFLKTADKKSEHFADLLVEDPDKYFAAMTTMLDEKKQEIAEENQTVLAKVNEEYQINKQKYEANRNYLKGLAKNCEQNLQNVLGKMNQQIEEMNKEAKKQATIAAGGCKWRDDVATLSPESNRSVCDMVKGSSSADENANPTMVHVNNVKENFKAVCEKVPEDSAEPEVIFQRTSHESAKSICSKPDWENSIACKKLEGTRSLASTDERCEGQDMRNELRIRLGGEQDKELYTCFNNENNLLVTSDKEKIKDLMFETVKNTDENTSTEKPTGYRCTEIGKASLTALKSTTAYKNLISDLSCSGGEKSQKNIEFAEAQVKLQYMKWSYTEAAQSMVENTPGCNEVYNSQFDPSLHQIEGQQFSDGMFGGHRT